MGRMLLELRHTGILLVAAVAALNAVSLGHRLCETGCWPSTHSAHHGRRSTRSASDKEGPVCCCRSAHHSMCRLFDAEECPSESGYADFSKVMGGDAPRPEECTKPAEESRGEPKNVTIKVYWMRHGVSCTNLIGTQGVAPVKHRLGYGFFRANWKRLQEGMSEEAVLADIGVARAEAFGAIIRAKLAEIYGEAAQRMLVFSSMMMRSILTALLNFPGTDVQPLPYIAESTDYKCNFPVSWEKQKKNMAKFFGTEIMDRVVFDICEPEQPARYGKDSRHDYNTFLQYFPSFLEAYLREQGVTIKQDQEIPVVIVSHSDYMKDYLECGSRFGRKPFNNEVWEQTYRVRLGAKEQAMVEEGECKGFPDVVDMFPARDLDMLCETDIDYCPEIKSKLKGWLEHDKAMCEAVGYKNVLQRDWDANMIYTREFDKMVREGKISAEDVKRVKERRNRSESTRT